jgi:dCMP deaminase
LKKKDDRAFSKYERKNKKFYEKFKTVFGKTCEHSNHGEQLKGRNLSFCFKDIQNEVDDEKNQVHTRALHAEENAFLQIAKYGGQPLKGGILSSTACPCELCAKKAYQLGISKIIYVDPYPGIASDNIINSGIPSNQPKMTLYRGALSHAYHRLYQPFMSYKDELQLLTGYELKKKETPEYEKLKEENLQLNQKIMDLEKASKIFCASLPDSALT